MKIVDARTGKEVKPGQAFNSPAGYHYLIHELREHMFSAEVCATRASNRGIVQYWQPLVVRYTHPKYFLQKVGFIPS